MFYRKWKIKNAIVLDVQSSAHLEAFLIKQGVLFLHVSDVSVVCRGVCVRLHTSYAEACMCTKNLNHMMYDSWEEMKCGRQISLSFWAIFCPFTPLTTQQVKILKIMKKAPGDNMILHIDIKNHICYTVPEI